MESFLKNIGRSVLRAKKDLFFCIKYNLTFPFNRAYPIFHYDQAPFNSVLQTKEEIDNVKLILKKLRVIRYPGDYKNWDSIAFTSIIATNVSPNERILDAGGEYTSTILPWLRYLNYKNLSCINLDMKDKMLRGISYSRGDITKTPYKKESFGAVTCQSVIEHGVDPTAYFKEMARIIKPGGLLITSTDYWETPIDTKGMTAYGVPIKIFTKEDIELMILIAADFGFELEGELYLTCKDKVVKWRGLEYTFVYFTLRKK